MKTTAPTISIIIPALNEAGTIRELVSRIDVAMAQNAYSYEVIIIVDASTDGTLKLAQALAKTYPVRALAKQGARGKAQSLLEGFSYSKADVVAMIDADLQYPPEALVAMLKAYDDGADVVLTRRSDNETSLLRRFISAGFNLAVARLIHNVAYDTQSGLKLFRRNLLNHMALKPSPWSFDLEFIVRAREAGATFAEVPITFAKRTEGEAKINLIRASYEIGLASLRLKHDLLRERSYQRKGYQS